MQYLELWASVTYPGICFNICADIREIMYTGSVYKFVKAVCMNRKDSNSLVRIFLFISHVWAASNEIQGKIKTLFKTLLICLS